MISRRKTLRGSVIESVCGQRLPFAVILASVSSMVLPGGSSAVSAQPALEEIVVTASRRSESLQDVAASVVSIDPNAYANVGLTRLEDVLNYTPGVTFNSGGQPGYGRIVMRAVTQESFTPVTGVYLDDVPLTSSSPFANSDFAFDAFLGDIERVEVIKGPQGTLYGATAMGGAVRYITRDPALEEMRGEILVDISDTNKGGTNEQYKGSISLPIVKDRLGLSLTAFKWDQPGYIDLVDTPLAPAKNNFNGSDTEAFQGALLWRVSDRLDVKLSGLYLESDSGGRGSIARSYPEGTSRVGDYSTDQPPAAAPQLTQEYYWANVDYDLGFATLTSVTSSIEFQQVVAGDATAGFGAIADQITGSTPGTNVVPFVATAGSERFSQEFRLTSASSKSLEWIAGFYYADEDTNNSQAAVARPTGLNLMSVAFPTQYEELAVFGDITWFLTEDFDLTLGARYADNEVFLDASFAGLFGAGAPDAEILFGDSIEDRVTTWLASARWRPNDNTSVYARVASGYRPAIVNLPIFNPLTGENLVEPVVEADELWSYELGIKGSVANGRLGYDMAIWYIDWEEFQASVILNSISTSGNADSAIEAFGFEGSYVLALTDALHLQAGFSYTESELSDDDLSLGALAGESSRLLPDWQGSLRVLYEFSVAGWQASLTGGLRHVGGFDTAYSSGVPGCLCAVNIPVDDYTIVDASASLGAGAYTLSLYATNLLDEYAIVGAQAADTFGGVNYADLIARPRTIGASIKYNF